MIRPAALTFLFLSVIVGTSSSLTSQVKAQSYQVERLVKPAQFQGLQSIAVDSGGRIFAGSVFGQGIFEVTLKGKVKPVIGAPMGMASDIAFGPDDSMNWTAPFSGKVYSQKNQEPPRLLAEGLNGVESLAFDKKGRLFVNQVTSMGGSLYEVDPKGEKKPRKVMDKITNLKGFAFGSDGLLYGAAGMQLIRIDVDKAELKILAEEFRALNAAIFDLRGTLYLVDTAAAQIIRYDPASGQKSLVTRLKSGLGKLAISPQGNLLVVDMPEDGIIRVDPNSGRANSIVSSKLTIASGLTLAVDDTREMLYVADVYGLQSVDPANGKVNNVLRIGGDVLDYPFNITASGRSLFMSSWLQGSVQRYDRVGKKHLYLVTDLDTPMDAVDIPGKAFVVAEYAPGRVSKISGKNYETKETVVTDLGGPLGMVYEDFSHVLVTEHIAGRITRVSHTENTKAVLVKDLKGPEGIARTQDGLLIIAEVGERRVISVDPKTGKKIVLASSLPIGLPAPPGTPASFITTGVAVSKDGTVYVSADREGAIYRIRKQ